MSYKKAFEESAAKAGTKLAIETMLATQIMCDHPEGKWKEALQKEGVHTSYISIVRDHQQALNYQWLKQCVLEQLRIRRGEIEGGVRGMQRELATMFDWGLIDHEQYHELVCLESLQLVFKNRSWAHFNFDGCKRHAPLYCHIQSKEDPGEDYWKGSVEQEVIHLLIEE